MDNNIEIDIELREKWLQALESGEYKQGKTYLRCENKFCCLGVLADLSGVAWIEKPYELKSEQVYMYRKEDGSHEMYAFTHDDLNARVGIQSYDGELAEMNDNGKSFAEIAAFIREMGVNNGDQDE